MSRHIAVLALLLMGISATARAQQPQPVDSFDALQLLVRRSDTVTVTDLTGQAVKGQILDLSSTSLTLLAAGKRRDFPEHEVRSIHQRRPDSLKNGGLWGLGVGAASGVILSGMGCALASLSGDADGTVPIGCVLKSSLIIAGIGAGIGAGVDILIKGDHPIYVHPPPSVTTVTISPFVTLRGKGVLLTLQLTK